MNYVFSDMLDVRLLVYMDDIFVYADTQEEHDERVRKVLGRITENGLVVSSNKCLWRLQEVEFLGYIIRHDRSKMIPEKVEAVLS